MFDGSIKYWKAVRCLNCQFMFVAVTQLKFEVNLKEKYDLVNSPLCFHEYPGL